MTHKVVDLKLINLFPLNSHWNRLAIHWITMGSQLAMTEMILPNYCTIGRCSVPIETGIINFNTEIIYSSIEKYVHITSERLVCENHKEAIYNSQIYTQPLVLHNSTPACSK